MPKRARSPNLKAWYRRPFKRSKHERSKREPLCAFDIDGTLTNIDTRLNLAPGVRGIRRKEDWDIVLDGRYYHLDTVIPEARAFVHSCAKSARICYLSGRRKGTESFTKDWLIENDFPRGIIIHRQIGTRSCEFKKDELLKLKNRYNVKFYVGDRIKDDCFGCLSAGIRAILVVTNKWVTEQQAEGGLKRVIEDTAGSLDEESESTSDESSSGTSPKIDKEIKQVLRRSQWLEESYPTDINPAEPGGREDGELSSN